MAYVEQTSNDGITQPLAGGGSFSSQLEQIPDILRLKKLREDVLDSEYRLCTQKAFLMTEYFLKNHSNAPLANVFSKFHYKMYSNGIEETSRKIPQKLWKVKINNDLNKFFESLEARTPSENAVIYAKALDYILKNMDLVIYDDELIVGNPSSVRIGAPIHPDLGGIMMLPEIDTLAIREQNPMATDKEQVRNLKEVVFPYWFNKSVLARTPLYSGNDELSNIMLDGRYFVLTQFAGVSHVTPDYPAVIKKGFKGIKEEIIEKADKTREELKKAKGGARGQTRKSKVKKLQEKLLFYQAAQITADAAIDYGKRWKRFLLENAAKEEDEVRRAELDHLASVFETVPANPATTFHEALQSIFITHTMLHQESFQHGISYGRMDQYLFPLYASDIEQGRLTVEKAAELFGCFLVKAGELLPLFFNMATEYFSGLSSASGITLGGKSDAGMDGTNELSYLMLRAYDQVRLRQPNFHVRVTDNTPPDFIALCGEILKRGGGMPAFFNDNKIAPALAEAGIEKRDADDYSIVGCVEWGCPGKSFPAAGAVFVNMAMALHLALHNGRFDDNQFGPQTGILENMRSMEDLLRAFRLQLQNLVETAVEGNNAIEKAHALHRPTPLLSTVVEGCIDKGLEINSGGAVYNSTGCQGVGLADVVDSLAAIQHFVFDKKEVSLAEFIRAVDDDFRELDNLRTRILNSVPKYCEDSEETDKFATIVSGMYQDIVFKNKNPRGGNYYPGFWSMTTHQGFGAKMPALPSGRRKGEPLANGASSCNGSDKHGPTAAMSSASRLDGARISNGYAFNQKLNVQNLEGGKGNEIISGLIKGYFNMGGMQIQFNMVSPETLMEAMNNPEKYRDLVVRVSGYSAYFNDLTNEMKEELIARTIFSFGEGSCC